MSDPATESAPAPLTLYERDDETEELVRESVEDIIGDLSKAIDGAWLSGIDIPIATAVAMQKLRQVVRISAYAMDGAIADMEVRVPDREPAPPSIDTWARGVVPTRQKIQSDDERFMARVGSAGTGTPSVSSYRSGKSGTKMSAYGSVRSRMSSGDGGFRGLSTGNYGDPEIFELDDSRPSSKENNKTNDKFEKYRKEQRRKNKNNPIVADMEEKDEFEMIRNTLENERKTLKVKRYAIDSEGHPIPISGTKPEDLPRYSMDLSANITSFQHNDKIDEIPAINKAQDKSATTDKKGSKKVRISGARGVDESHFIPSKTLATVLSETPAETFDVKAGVSLKTGAVTLEGPAPPVDPKKMSRKDFLERKRDRGVTDGSSVVSAVSGEITDGLDAGNSLTSLDSDTMSRTRGSRLVDVNPLEGGKPKLPVDNTIRPITDRELGLGPVQGTAKAQPANLPKKPSSKQHEIVKDFVGGVDKAGPRDRLPPSMAIPTTDRKKLPPPGSGQTSGHGMGDNSSVGSASYRRSKNSPTQDNSSLGGDNSTIHSSSSLQKNENKGTIKKANPELADEMLY